MRHSKKAALSALSVLAILTGTAAAEASSSRERFGWLKPQGEWKVGTASAADGVPYCAMVNQYDEDVVLAFARNADGQGSVAVDFHKEFFTPGAPYEISLQIEDAKKLKLTGRASSERSVVVQVGQDEKFYAALSEGGNLTVDMADLTATFAVRRISQPYVSLLDCAAGLPQGPQTAAVPVPGVEKTPLASVDAVPEGKDKEVVEAESKSVQESLTAKEAQLEQQKQKVAELEHKTGEQIKTRDALKLAVDSKEREIAQMREAQKDQETKRTGEISQKEHELALHVSDLQKDRDTLKLQMEALKKSVQDNEAAVQANRTIKENLVAKEAQLAEAIKQQVQKPAEMSRALSEAQAEYQAKLASAEVERNEMKKRLDTVVAENIPLKASMDQAQKDLAVSKAHVADLEGRLALLTQQKQELATKMEAQDAQAKQLQAVITAKDMELMSTKATMVGDSQKLEDTQAELKNLAAERASVVDKLQTELTERSTQYDSIKKQYDEQNKALPVTFRLAADLAAKKASEAQLQQKLAEAEMQRQAAAEAADKAQAAIADLKLQQEQKLAAIQLERDELNKRLSDIAEDLTNRQALLNKRAAEQGLEDERLKARSQKLTELESGLQKHAASVTADNAAALSTVQAKLSRLEKSMAADTHVAAAGSKAPSRYAAFSVAEISPFAGGNDPAPAGNAPVPLAQPGSLNSAEEFLNRIMMLHRAPGAKARAAAPVAVERKVQPAVPAGNAEEKVTLETLLNGSGLAINNFAPVDETPGNLLSKWTSGKISGMYEQVAAENDFTSQVNDYISRYRQDCSDGLEALVSPAQTGRIGVVAMADIACGMPSNDYTTAFLFWRDANGFNAVIHTGYPSEKTDVRSARDRIAQALRQAGGFAAPKGVEREAPPPQFKFNISSSVEAAPVSPDATDELETVVIQ